MGSWTKARNKPVSSIPLFPLLCFCLQAPALNSCPGFPRWWTVTITLNKLFPPVLFWVMIFISATDSTLCQWVSWNDWLTPCLNHFCPKSQERVLEYLLNEPCFFSINAPPPPDPLGLSCFLPLSLFLLGSHQWTYNKSLSKGPPSLWFLKFTIVIYETRSQKHWNFVWPWTSSTLPPKLSPSEATKAVTQGRHLSWCR